MKMIAGLGNPGYEYDLTPHNLGFMAVDRLAGECGLELAHYEAQALTASTRLEGLEVLLAKPQTYMNLSGMAVARLVAKYGLEVGDLIVLVDDAALPLGSLRIRPRGTAGGHNGLKSIIGALDSGDFVRVRMGVGPEQPIERYGFRTSSGDSVSPTWKPSLECSTKPVKLCTLFFEKVRKRR